MKVNRRKSEPSEKVLGVKRAKRSGTKPSKKTRLNSQLKTTVENFKTTNLTELSDVQNTGGIPMDCAELDATKSSERVKLSTAQRKRLKKKQAKALRAAGKAMLQKPAKEEPPISSCIVLPKTTGFVSNLDTDEKKLAAAQSRLAEFYADTLKLQPIPRPCPPGLLKDLCPLAINVRIPMKSSARYAFLQFRNPHELDVAKRILVNKSLNGKPIRVCLSSPQPRADKPDWVAPESRQMSDFLWNTLFVAHLPRSTTRPGLGQVFRKATSIRMPTFDDGSCKGTCFLTYKSPHAALQAFETRHRTIIRGSPIYVNFALKQAIKAVESVPDVSMSDLTPSAAEPVENKTPASSPQTTHVPTTSVEFTIDRTASRIPSSHKKKRITIQADTVHSPPKMIQKYQIKPKTEKTGSLSALELLLRPPASKPKHSKKSKRLTKRGKASKHR